MFSDSHPAPPAWYKSINTQVEFTQLADYVWLPFRFDGDYPILEWRDEWSPDDFD